MINKRAIFAGFILLAVFLIYGLSFAVVPRGIGGFILGGKVEAFYDKLNMETARPVRYREYLREVEIKKLPGFKNGTIWYNAVSTPHRIVRIKLKYEDSSKEFFDALLERLSK